MNMEVLLTQQQSDWDDTVAKGKVIALGRSRVGFWQSAFVVPTYVVEQNPQLKMVQDIRHHLDIFPLEDGKVVLTTCRSGSECFQTTEAQVEAYGLDDIIVLKPLDSLVDMLSSFWIAYGSREPWLGYLQSPSEPALLVDPIRLEEPLCPIGAGPETGCAYPAEMATIVAHPSLQERARGVVRFLSKWYFDPSTEIAAHTHLAEPGATIQNSAIWWLRNQQDLWTQWVPATVAQNVIDSLIIEPLEPTVANEPATCRSGPGANDGFRAVHMMGNWGLINELDQNILPLSEDYLRFLHRINANWVGINVALNVSGSLDSTVERIYEEPISTYRDETLTAMFNALHQAGCHVYLTLAFQENEADDANHPVDRGQLGNPNVPPQIPPENWPWAPDHPDHEVFVAEFWRTHTDQAVHFAELAEATGVEMFSLGGETEWLFRTRSGGWPNDFATELTSMVSAVRSVYSGLLTYDMSWRTLNDPDNFGPRSNHLWEDLGLDVVGISAYFRLADTRPNTTLSVEELEERWEKVFIDYLVPLKDRNPGIEIVFTEFGYTNSILAPNNPGARDFRFWLWRDNDGNRLDDNQEVQSNIYTAFFNVNDRHDKLVAGAFLWGHEWASDNDWTKASRLQTSFSVRDRLAEDVVRAYYASQLDD